VNRTTASPTWGARRSTTKSLSRPEAHAGAGARVHRAPGAPLTQLHVASLAESYGRGAMTNHWIDVKNADVILVMGPTLREPPVSFQWVMEAKKKGAKLIVVDPRFTRSAALAISTRRSGPDRHRISGG